MNKDEYNEILNGENTYKTIAKELIKLHPVLIGWTDENGSHYDILFTLKVYKEEGNYFQRGIRGNELFVSILSKGAFGFDVHADPNLSSGYVAEKLNLNCCITTDKLTELINNVITYTFKGWFGYDL